MTHLDQLRKNEEFCEFEKVSLLLIHCRADNYIIIMLLLILLASLVMVLRMMIMQAAGGHKMRHDRYATTSKVMTTLMVVVLEIYIFRLIFKLTERSLITSTV